MNKKIVILGTSARGGIRSVIDAYNASGFYSPGSSQTIFSHTEGKFIQKIFEAIRACISVCTLLIHSRVSVIHIHMASYGSFWRKSFFILIASCFNVPIIVHIHGGEFVNFYNNSFINKIIIQYILNRASAIIVLSEYWRNFFETITCTNIFVIKNFVRDLFNNDQINLCRNKMNCLFLGVFSEKKGIIDLIYSFSEVVKKYPNAKLYCAGNGDANNVKSIVEELCLDNSVDVIGWVDGVDKNILLHKCSLFILPSYNEGLPMAIIEAMSFKMPIISTGVGGIPELVDEYNGKLITPGDRKMLTQAIIDMFNYDDSSFEKLAHESRRRYDESFSPRASMSEMKKLYLSFGVEP